MHNFDNQKGIRRLLDISNMKTEEVKDYYLQFFSMEPDKKETQIKQLKEEIRKLGKPENYKWILAIKSKKGKIVGKIEVFELAKEERAYVTIEIPNENWVNRYGKEAIHEFLRICKENHYFSSVELEARNKIVEQYIDSVPEDQKEGYLIKIA